MQASVTCYLHVIHRYTRMVRTIRVWYTKLYHTRMVHTIRIWYIPYAYGTYHTRMVQNIATYSVAATVCTYLILMYMLRADLKLDRL